MRTNKNIAHFPAFVTAFYFHLIFALTYVAELESTLLAWICQGDMKAGFTTHKCVRHRTSEESVSEHKR